MAAKSVQSPGAAATGHRDGTTSTMQLVLIGGAQRSGTTLLQTLLANALATPVLSEAHILCDLLAAFKRAKSTPRKTQYYYKTDGDLLAFFRDCANRHIADLMRNVGGASALVLKDPNLIRVDAEAAAVLPGAIRIACLRDPRDIAASFLRIGQREQPKGAPGKYRRRDIDFIGKKILGSYAPLMQDGAAVDVILVRYEDVVTKPQETLADLSRETGLPLSLERINAMEWLEAESRHDAAWITELEEKGPSAASVGAYKTVMRPSEIALTEQLCAPLMAWAGYESAVPRMSSAGWGLTRLPRALVRRMRGG
jgi:Sulfotransferase family